MKARIILCALALPLAGWTAVAGAQTEKPQTPEKPKPQNPEKPKNAGPGDQAVSTKALPFCHKAGEVVGSKVQSPKGEDLGKVEELVVDPVTGKIDYAVLSFGGTMGLGDKLFAIPYSMLKAPPAPEGSRAARFMLDVDKAKLEKAPGFPKDNWPDVQAPAFAEGIDKYFGTSRSSATKAVDANARLELCKASEMIGHKIVTPTNDDLGTVKEVVLDPGRGRVTYFVLSSGGFLGMGDKLFAVPWEAVKVTREGDKDKSRFVVAIGKERFEKAPEFSDKDWTRMSDPVWVRDVYSYYGYKPYWLAAEAPPRG